ncbi:MAG: hypothetical protein V4598_06895 [Bdellovibrionota bacterium]
MKFIIALCLIFSSISSFACRQPVCRSVTVCVQNSKRPTCHKEQRCTGGTCGQKSLLSLSGLELPATVSEEIISRNLSGQSFEIRAYVSERAEPQYYVSVYPSLESGDELFSFLQSEDYPSVFIAQGSSYRRMCGIFLCDNKSCFVRPSPF